MNIVVEKDKVINSKIREAREKNPELSVPEARKQIEQELQQQGYDKAIEEIVSKITSEIPATRRTTVTVKPANNVTEPHNASIIEPQEPNASGTSDNNEVGESGGQSINNRVNSQKPHRRKATKKKRKK